MNFQVTEKYKRGGKRKVFIGGVLVVAIIAGAVWTLIASDSSFEKLLSIVVIVIMAKSLPRAWRNFKNHDASHPVVSILESENKIEISHLGAVVSIPLSDIESLRVQSVKGNVTSLLLNTKSFSDLRFEGYEDLSKMAEILGRYAPAGKTKIATWYHR